MITPEQISSTVLSLLTPGRDLSVIVPHSILGVSADLLDPSRPLKVRRRAAWLLAKIDSDEALTILRQALRDAPPQLKAAIAEALGDAGNVEARTMLGALLKDKEAVVIRGAIRGIAAREDSESVKLLSSILLDPGSSDDIRAEAALALGTSTLPSAYDSLVQALNRAEDKELAKAILSGLGQRSFEESERFFTSYLEQPNVEPEMRIAALEALGEATGNSSPLLLRYLQDSNAEVRAAAAWALANVETPGEIAPQLLRQLAKEAETEVRTRIYQALENQRNFDAGRLLSSVIDEANATPRLAGYKLLASQVRLQNGAFAAQFDELVVPRLGELALQGTDPATRLGAVSALRQARTMEARRALDVIAARSAEPKIATAAKLK